MLSAPRYSVSIALLILFSFKAGLIFSQPSLLDKRVTLQVSNVTVSSVIEKISSQTGTRFSYDPSQVNASRKVTLNVSNQSVGSVLRQVFPSRELNFREVGNQVVIYKPNLPQSESPPSLRNLTTQEISSEKNEQMTSGEKVLPVPDTFYIRVKDTFLIHTTDTLIIYNTIVRVDTLHKTDTVFIEKSRAQKSTLPENPRFDRNSMRNRLYRQHNGWYFGISYEQIFSSPELKESNNQYALLLSKMKEANTLTPLNYSLNFMMGYDFPVLGVRSGLGFCRLGETFEYSFSQQVGGFYKTDTVETYYTISGIDTSWYYVTDSSWVNIDYKRYDFKNPNAYRYLELPLTLRFRAVRNERFELYALAGVIAGINIGKKALVILDSPEYPVGWLPASMISSFVFSWQSGLGCSFSLGGGVEVFAEVLYRKQMTDLYKDYPIEKKFESLNAKTGIFVRLN
jgi:hypothetical protein